jgi:hypothetical protein
MAVNLTITRATIPSQPAKSQVPHPGGLLEETLKIVGAASSAADTGDYTPEWGHGITPMYIEGGGFTISVSGNVVTVTDVQGIGSSTVYAKLIGRPS